MSKFSKFYCIAIISVLFSCGDKDKGGESLNIAAIEPPVASVTPDALKAASALNLREYVEDVNCSEKSTDDEKKSCYENRSLSRLVIRIFQGKEGCNGDAPSDMAGRIRCNLNKVDSRISTLDSRSVESKRKCASEDTKDFAIALPAGITKTAKINCSNILDENAKTSIAFGKSGSDFYLVQNQPTGILYAQVSGNDYEVLIGSSKIIDKSLTDGDSSDGTKTSGSSDHDGKYALSLMQLKANTSDKSFELAIGANHSIGNGVGCGVRLKSDGSYVYAKGIFAEPKNTSLDEVCDDADSALDICLSASDFSKVEDDKCAKLKSFTVKEILPTGFKQENYTAFGANSYGVTDFDEDAAK